MPDYELKVFDLRVAMFVNIALQTIFHRKFVHVFIMYLRLRFTTHF
jgi:hypothetical protein